MFGMCCSGCLWRRTMGMLSGLFERLWRRAMGMLSGLFERRRGLLLSLLLGRSCYGDVGGASVPGDDVCRGCWGIGMLPCDRRTVVEQCARPRKLPQS